MIRHSRGSQGPSSAFAQATAISWQPGLDTKWNGRQMGVNPNGFSELCIIDFFSEMHPIIFPVSFAKILGEQFPLNN